VASDQGRYMTDNAEKWDIVFAGGGLANGLLAYRFHQLRPDLNILVVERDTSLGGNHTWSFYESDVSQSQREWLAPFIVYEWPDYEVRFTPYSRVLPTGYASITSDRFHDVLSQALGPSLVLGAEIRELSESGVVLSDGRTLSADIVVDGRGVSNSKHLVLGFQKFVGWEVELENPHGQTRPIIMDATVEQLDGYRFVYTLPFDEKRILIEDTYYSDGAVLSQDKLKSEIRSYAERRGWSIKTVVREEHGVLPITLAGDIDLFWSEGPSAVARTGLRSALFHPITGYSLLEAVRLADRLAHEPIDQINQIIRTYSKSRWSDYGFYRLLNRMLFQAAEPGKRHKVFDRFYRLPEALIERFYAGQLTYADKVRLLVGKPPVPVFAAAKCLSESQFLNNRTDRGVHLEA